MRPNRPIDPETGRPLRGGRREVRRQHGIAAAKAKGTWVDRPKASAGVRHYALWQEFYAQQEADVGEVSEDEQPNYRRPRSQSKSRVTAAPSSFELVPVAPDVQQVAPSVTPSRFDEPGSAFALLLGSPLQVNVTVAPLERPLALADEESGVITDDEEEDAEELDEPAEDQQHLRQLEDPATVSRPVFDFTGTEPVLYATPEQAANLDGHQAESLSLSPDDSAEELDDLEDNPWQELGSGPEAPARNPPEPELPYLQR